MFTQEESQPRHREAEGRRLNRGFTFLMDHGSKDDLWDGCEVEGQVQSTSSPFLHRQQKAHSTPWTRVVNPRHETQSTDQPEGVP
jgi:hypothetical protein